MAIPNEVKDLMAEAEEQGFEVTLTANGHIRFKPPNKRKKLVFTGTTPSDYRSIKNLRSRLQRSGLKRRRDS